MNTSASKLELSSGEDEISLYDLWQMLAEGRLWIICGAIAGLIGATAYLLFVSPQYEATALVQIGQIGQIGQAQANQGRIGPVVLVPIETQARVIERILQPSFKIAVLKKLGWEAEPRAALYLNFLKVAPTKSADLIELKLMVLTREDAEKAITTTIEHFAFTQRIISQPATERLQTQLKEISTEIKEKANMLAELDRFARQQGLGASHGRPSEWILYMQLWSGKEERLKELRHLEAQYREAISLTGKAGAVALEAPWVSATPVFPKKGQTLMLATMGGLFLGVLAVALRRGLQNRPSAKG
jgi:capsular polysaccharide biosynthesis protein